MSYTQLTDDEIKHNVSTLLHRLTADLQQARPERQLWDKDYCGYVAERTGVELPVTTWRSYKAGERARLAALETFAVAFNIPLALFLGEHRAKEDSRRMAHWLGFPLPYFGAPNSIAATIPEELAKNLGLHSGNAAAFKVSGDNNGSTSLRLGSLAIIDTSYAKVGVSGDYLVRNANGDAVIASVKAGVGVTVNVQLLDSSMTVPLSELIVLGRVAGSIG